MAASSSNAKQISKSTLQRWESELLESFDFIYDDSGSKAIKAFCKVCRAHCAKIVTRYKGKLVNDVVNYHYYGKNGTSHLLLMVNALIYARSTTSCLNRIDKILPIFIATK